MEHGADMGKRFYIDRRVMAGTAWYNMWAGLHQGKYWKRQMNKARRRAWKQQGIEGTPVNKYETFCKYKGW